MYLDTEYCLEACEELEKGPAARGYCRLSVWQTKQDVQISNSQLVKKRQYLPERQTTEARRFKLPYSIKDISP